MTIEEPTDIEVFALRQHILSHEQRLGKECGASLKFEHGGGKPYMGKLEVLYHGKPMFTIWTPNEERCYLLSPASLTFDQCCQWMMFSREKLSFDYLEFTNGWKPWKK